MTLLPTPLRSQENRLFSLLSPLPQAGLILDRFQGFEAVSEPFRFTLDLLGERGDLALGPFLGKPMGVLLRTAAGAARPFHGHITRFRHLGGDGGLARFEAVLEPWTAFLDRRTNCKLFQNHPLPEILRQVFEPYGALARFELHCSASDFRPITLCVQYGESDFRFVSRLLEAHGLHYRYRFQEDGHVLVVADDSTLAPALPGAPMLAFNAVPGAAREDTVDGWSAGHVLVPTAVAARSYDFKAPRDTGEVAEPTLLATDGLPAMEDYQYAGAYGYPDLGAGQKRVRRAMEVHEAGAETYLGRSNCRHLACGHGFELVDHHRLGATVHDRRYFITRVEHEGRNNYLAEASPADYRNRFACVPKLVPWRPARSTPKPLIHGPQTATVVGPPGEEIHCDAHGRVRLQFHWDRLGRRDDASSCWVRVATPWAGARFGCVAVPRIGSEVVVEFLDGDPDRPLVTGQVYNELQPPPWPLPEARTQAGILTRSSKDGSYEQSNALRFEDRKGEEEVWLHAERDQRIEVEHDESTAVGHDRSEQVGHDETIAIGNDRSEQVGHDERISIGRDRSEQVGGDEDLAVAGHQSLSVGRTQSITIGAAKTESVTLASAEQVGGARTLTVGAAYAVSVGAAKTEVVAMASHEQVGQGKTTLVGAVYHIDAAETFDLTVGASRLTLASDGTITLSGKQINILAEGPLKLVGKDIEAN